MLPVSIGMSLDLGTCGRPARRACVLSSCLDGLGCAPTATDVAGADEVPSDAAPVNSDGPSTGTKIALRHFYLGVRILDGSSISGGPVLRFSVTGDGVSINPETGELSLLTDSLLEGFAVTVTLADESGTVSRVFRLAMDPVEAASGTTPQPTAQPILEGTGEIGTVVTVDPGQWSGTPEPEIALQWCLDGEAIAGASAAEYAPVTADDGRSLHCRVTARNAIGSASAETEALEVRFAAPTAVDVLADLAAIEGEEALVVEAAAAFAGDGLTFAVTGAEATIDAATGRLTIPTAAPRAAETITVTATNSGGTASVQFQVAIEPRVADVPGRIPATLWSADEVRDEAPEGRRRVSISPEVAIPAGFELRLYSGPERLASQPSLDTTRAMQPGETFTTRGGLTIGTVCHNLLFWYRPEDGVWTQASENVVVFEIAGLEPAEPAEPLPVAPAVLSAPVLAGSGKIDSELAVDAGAWSGEPEISLQWLRDEEPIPDATAAVYVPVPEDDLTEVCCRVTARNAAGETEVETETIRVTYVAPVPVGELHDEIFDEDTGIQEVPTAQAFEGQNLAFTVTGAGASINAASGVVTIDTATPGFETITVAATNSGGEATQSFQVTIEALPEDPLDIPSIAADLWLFEAEAWSAEQSGARMSITPAAAIAVPEGYELRGYIGGNPAGVGATSMTARLVPGTKFVTNGFFSGDVHARLYWRQMETDSYETADEGGKALSVLSESILPPAKPEILLQPTEDMLAQAAAMPNPRYGPRLNPETGQAQWGQAGTQNNGFNGQHPLVLALGELSGQASQRNALISRMKFICAPGNEPAAEGNYAQQHEMNAYAAAAVLRDLPFWTNELTQTERDRWDTIMKACLFSGAFSASDLNPYLPSHPQRDIAGHQNNWRNGNPNHRLAYCLNPIIAMAYFGGATAAQALLDTFNVDIFVAEAISCGLNNIARTYTRANWPNGPTKAQMETAIRGYTFEGRTLSQWLQVIEAEVLNTNPGDRGCINKIIKRGLNNGLGVSGTNGCGTTIQNLVVPNEGQLGMWREFDAMDSGGPRCSLEYVIGGYRCLMSTIVVLAARGYWDAKNATVRAIYDRINLANTDAIWKQREAGHKDYSISSCRRTWQPNSETDNASWGFTYTWGLWEQVLKPAHQISEASPKDSGQPDPNNPPAVGTPGETVQSATVSQDGLTVMHSKSHTIGTYNLGDHWVLAGSGDPATIVSRSPASQQVDGTWRNGMMAFTANGHTRYTDGSTADERILGNEGHNAPMCPQGGLGALGFDQRMSVRSATPYRDRRDLGRALPLVVTEGTVLSSRSDPTSHSEQNISNGSRRCIERIIPITYVGTAPPAGSFRPGIMANGRASLWTEADMDLSILPSYPVPPGLPSPIDLFDMIRRIRNVWTRNDHNSRSAAMNFNMRVLGGHPGYGRDMGRTLGAAGIALLCNIPVQQKFDLAKAMVQIGIDVDSVVAAGGRWAERGAILCSWALPHLMAAMILNNAGMKSRHSENWRAFHEKRQIWTVGQGDVGRVLRPQRDGSATATYKQGDVGTPEWGVHHVTQPEQDGRSPYPGNPTSYRHVNSAVQQATAICVWAIPGAKEVWNYDVFLDYVDRMSGTDSINGFFDDIAGDGGNAPSAWSRAFYKAHRANWGSRIFGVNPNLRSAPLGGLGDGWS